MTVKTQDAGLLRPSQWQRQKPQAKKVSTTVRFDADLKRRAEEFARANHMDFTTFLQFSVKTVMQNGAKIEPVWHVSPEYAKKLEELDRRIESGEETIYGPFEWKEAIDFLKSLY